MLSTGSSWSLVTVSSLTGMRVDGAGDELWTTMAGVEVEATSGLLCWLRSEFRLERERVSWVGGGDLRRGETGQWGAGSPEAVPDGALRGRGTREASWAAVAGGSWGMLAVDRARCIEAAEGTVVLEPGRLGPLLGLTSVLLLRERRADLGRGPAAAAAAAAVVAAAVRCGGRAGECSRDDSGEFVAEGSPDRLSERAPLSEWWRMGAVDESSGSLEREWRAVGVVEELVEVDAGSADWAWPVRERKEGSLGSVGSGMSGMATGRAQRARRLRVRGGSGRGGHCGLRSMLGGRLESAGVVGRGRLGSSEARDTATQRQPAASRANNNGGQNR